MVSLAAPAEASAWTFAPFAWTASDFRLAGRRKTNQAAKVRRAIMTTPRMALRAGVGLNVTNSFRGRSGDPYAPLKGGVEARDGAKLLNGGIGFQPVCSVGYDQNVPRHIA